MCILKFCDYPRIKSQRLNLNVRGQYNTSNFLSNIKSPLKIPPIRRFRPHKFFKLKKVKKEIRPEENAYQTTSTVSVKLSSVPVVFSQACLYFPFTCWLPLRTTSALQNTKLKSTLLFVRILK